MTSEFTLAIEKSGMPLGEFVEFETVEDDLGVKNKFVSTVSDGWLFSYPYPSSLPETPWSLSSYLEEQYRLLKGPEVDLDAIEVIPGLADAHDRLVNSDYEEYQLVNFIKKYLVTTVQKKYLADNNVSIEDILNGRLHICISPFVSVFLFPQWNKKFGREIY